MHGIRVNVLVDRLLITIYYKNTLQQYTTLWNNNYIL